MRSLDQLVEKWLSNERRWSRRRFLRAVCGGSITAAAVLSGCQSLAGSSWDSSSSGAAPDPDDDGETGTQASKPPIDERVMENVQTATFALG
jgi:hypothetical protein